MVATPNDYVAPPMLYERSTIILSLNTSEPVPRSVQLGTIFFCRIRCISCLLQYSIKIEWRDIAT